MHHSSYSQYGFLSPIDAINEQYEINADCKRSIDMNFTKAAGIELLKLFEVNISCINAFLYLI